MKLFLKFGHEYTEICQKSVFEQKNVYLYSKKAGEKNFRQMFSFQVYHSVAEIYDWLDTVAEMPNVEMQTFGQSWENRPLKAVLSEIQKLVTSSFSYYYL